MAREATKKQKGFDTYALKRKLKSLTPAERIALNNGVEYAAKEYELNAWKPKESDYWNFLYILKCNEYFKIGITASLSDRLNQINTGNPYKVEVVWAEKHPKALEIENNLHRNFADKNIKREWFSLDKEDIERIKDYVTKYE